MSKLDPVAKLVFARDRRRRNHHRRSYSPILNREAIGRRLARPRRDGKPGLELRSTVLNALLEAESKLGPWELENRALVAAEAVTVLQHRALARKLA